MFYWLRFILIVFLLSNCSKSTDQFPSLNLDRSSVTVSGISSGGYMAHQYHLAYGSQVSGAALFASGPFGCAQGDLNIALADCVDSQQPPFVDDLFAHLNRLVEAEQIDALDNLSEDKVWIFHGQADQRVSRQVTETQAALYRKLQVQVATEFTVNAGHGIPTTDYGVPCNNSESPHINHCQYDGAGEALQVLYGELAAKTKATGKIIPFSQAKFLTNQSNTLAETGYAYVPSICLSGEQCRIHISFHGCSQNEESVGREYIEHSGFNSWAESNRLVIIYPQTKSSFVPLNPKACWDWWGYTGPDYQTKNGQQITHIHAIIKGLGHSF
ncbi:polyhydroxybutyrate depolymerase [Aliikangiella marina]|uniref:Polyhydroxybutyrate depolymerase n=1 Tax=Aliikangiella marina TaxID=1712262 RepID=A0A545T8U5_9GAMM|nr:polyhydroxybutyrate depolymerase [Aliikangiella marina]TQV73647.1 polyhydroxybutyrate depolymerase [Aliikangiella marina]